MGSFMSVDAQYLEKAQYSVPLERFTSLKCDQIEEVQSLVGDIFCPHVLKTKKTTRLPKFTLNHVKFGESSSLNYISYGSEICVEPGEMEDVFNVQLQLTGKTETVCGKQKNTISKGQAGVLSPTKYVTMDWSEDASMLIYSVSRSAVERKLQTILGNHLCEPIIFHSMMNCQTQEGASFWRSLKYLQNELETCDNILNTPLAVDHFEQSLILSLLYGQRHNYTKALTHGVCMAAPIHVKRVEEFIREHAAERITIDDLTEVSGVSARTLFAGFKQFRNTSPMRYLRLQRMKLVRNDLSSPLTNDTVTEIAMKWGFTQLGRFSVEYKKIYGESPSETLNSRLL